MDVKYTDEGDIENSGIFVSKFEIDGEVVKSYFNVQQARYESDALHLKQYDIDLKNSPKGD